MTKDEFDSEWTKLVRTCDDSVTTANWYAHVATRIPHLSLEAKHYIADNPDVFGDWLIELVVVYTLESALGLEVV